MLKICPLYAVGLTLRRFVALFDVFILRGHRMIDFNSTEGIAEVERADREWAQYSPESRQALLATEIDKDALITEDDY